MKPSSARKDTPAWSVVLPASLASLFCAVWMADAAYCQAKPAAKMKLHSIAAPEKLPFPMYSSKSPSKPIFVAGQAGPRAVLEMSQSIKDGPNNVLKWYSDALNQDKWKVNFQQLPPLPADCELKKLYFLTAHKDNKDLTMTIMSTAEPKKPSDTLVTIMVKE